MVLSKYSNYGTIYGKFEGYLMGAWFGWAVGFELEKNGGSEISFWDCNVLGTILSAVDGLPISKYDGTVLGYLESFIYGDVVGKCLCFCCCRGYVHM